jgi:hypothetical protein
MLNPDFLKFQCLKEELEYVGTLCPKQYFSSKKCSGPRECGRRHEPRGLYPCIFFYSGSCKYGHKCCFRHTLKRKVTRPDPNPNVCRAFFEYASCYNGHNCKYSHDLRGEPCVWNSLGNCKYTATECRYSHELKAPVSIPCFFHLMGACRNAECPHSHAADKVRSISY